MFFFFFSLFPAIFNFWVQKLITLFTLTVIKASLESKGLLIGNNFLIIPS